MKILLTAINAKYIHSNLAVYDLRAYAKDFEEHILLREYTINQTKDDILRAIYLEHPDVICMSCYIWNVSFVKELVMDLAKILPDTLFWAGGPEVSFDAERFLLENPAFTGVMMGEGEETFLELVKYYVEKSEVEPEEDTAEVLRNRQDMVRVDSGVTGLSVIKGIVYRAENGIRHNGCRIRHKQHHLL
ncbi:MAG: cobalamin B12-binding domain-containing protein, partial [Blautia sp.]|nr:cobalamin B12-binding domain-containing protein [Blautia sp.]